jgi:hypothetical protein
VRGRQWHWRVSIRNRPATKLLPGASLPPDFYPAAGQPDTGLFYSQRFFTGTGTVFADGCYSVRDDAPVICPAGFEPYFSETYGNACCPTQVAGCGEGCQGDVPEDPYGNPIGVQSDGGTCPCASPILIDVSGDGFALTDFAGGVLFDLDADGRASKFARRLKSHVFNESRASFI